MLIGYSTRIKIEDVLRIVNRSCAALCVLLPVFFFVLALSFFRSNGDGIQAEVSESARVEHKWPIEAIGGGPLSLSSYRTLQFLPRMGREVVLLAKNTRPDAAKKEVSFLLALKSSKEERVVKNGESVFLSESDQGRGSFHFSSTPTSLWVKPYLKEKRGVGLEVCRTVSGEEEKNQLVLSGESDAGMRTSTFYKKKELSFLHAIQEAKSWGKDQLFQSYGGAEFRDLKEKQKLQFTKENGSYVCFVSSGDTLVWEKQRWKAAPLQGEALNLPVARIKGASATGMDVDLWDETGFFHASLHIAAQTSTKIPAKVEPLFASIRLRNASEVTCIGGKRRVVIKEGDWLLRTVHGWRNLRRAEQIDDCLQHHLKGELFICDGLEKVEGKLFLKGHLFDEMRTAALAVSLPVAVEKKSSRKERRTR